MVAWLIYGIIHSVAHAYFNYTFIVDSDFHTAQVVALAIDFIALFYFMRRPFKSLNFLVFIGLAIIFCCLRWIIYDITLNLFLDQSVFYVGSGELDNLFGNSQYIVKGLFLFFSIIIFIVISKKENRYATTNRK